MEKEHYYVGKAQNEHDLYKTGRAHLVLSQSSSALFHLQISRFLYAIFTPFPRGTA